MPATAIKERPILFNAEMVRAILDGRKSQTRRVVKPQPSFPFGVKQIVLVDDPWHNDAFVGTPAEGMMGDGPREKQFHCEDYAGNLVARFDATCPYGQPGDRLWVKETWQHLHNDGSPLERLHDWEKTPVHCFYRADESDPTALPVWASGVPPSTCPAGPAASRSKSPRFGLQRVQQISEGDAKAEGCGLGCTVKSEQLWAIHERGTVCVCRAYGIPSTPIQSQLRLGRGNHALRFVPVERQIWHVQTHGETTLRLRQSVGVGDWVSQT
jgi:hypothetical protein